METLSSHSTSQELGFPVAAAISAASTVAGSVLPSVLGGGQKGPSRSDIIESRRATRRLDREIKSDLERIEAQAGSWSKVKAKDVLDRNAERIWRDHLSKYFDIATGAGVNGANDIANRMAEIIRSKAIEAAENRKAMITLQENGPALVGGALGLAGGGFFLWNQLKN
jgi:hypothetical protein